MKLTRLLSLPTLTSPRLLNQYNRVAQSWHRSIEALGYSTSYRQLVQHAHEHHYLPVRASPLDVLEVGIGTASLSLAMADVLKPTIRITGCDWSSAMLDQARQNLANLNPQAHLQRIDLCQPIPDSIDQAWHGRFDVLLCSHLLEHFTDPEALLRQFTHWLKPDGIVVLVVSKQHFCTWLLHWRWRHRYFSRDAVFAMTQSANLTTIDEFDFTQGPPSRTSRAYLLSMSR